MMIYNDLFKKIKISSRLAGLVPASSTIQPKKWRCLYIDGQIVIAHTMEASLEDFFHKPVSYFPMSLS